jgi:hypothetical protein
MGNAGLKANPKERPPEYQATLRGAPSFPTTGTKKICVVEEARAGIARRTVWRPWKIRFICIWRKIDEAFLSVKVRHNTDILRFLVSSNLSFF